MTGTISEAPDDGEGAAIAAPAATPRKRLMKAPVSSFKNEGMGETPFRHTADGAPRLPQRAQRVPDCLHFSKK